MRHTMRTQSPAGRANANTKPIQSHSGLNAAQNGEAVAAARVLVLSAPQPRQPESVKRPTTKKEREGTYFVVAKERAARMDEFAGTIARSSSTASARNILSTTENLARRRRSEPRNRFGGSLKNAGDFIVTVSRRGSRSNNIAPKSSTEYTDGSILGWARELFGPHRRGIAQNNTTPSNSVRPKLQAKWDEFLVKAGRRPITHDDARLLQSKSANRTTRTESTEEVPRFSHNLRDRLHRLVKKITAKAKGYSQADLKRRIDVEHQTRLVDAETRLEERRASICSMRSDTTTMTNFIDADNAQSPITEMNPHGSWHLLRSSTNVGIPEMMEACSSCGRAPTGVEILRYGLSDTERRPNGQLVDEPELWPRAFQYHRDTSYTDPGNPFSPLSPKLPETPGSLDTGGSSVDTETSSSSTPEKQRFSLFRRSKTRGSTLFGDDDLYVPPRRAWRHTKSSSAETEPLERWPSPSPPPPKPSSKVRPRVQAKPLLRQDSTKTDRRAKSSTLFGDDDLYVAPRASSASTLKVRNSAFYSFYDDLFRASRWKMDRVITEEDEKAMI